MIIKNVVPVKNIKIPYILENKLLIFSDCDFDGEIIDLFNISLELVSKQLEKENFCKNNIYSINILFSCDGVISFHPDTSILELGLYTRLIVYRIDKLMQAPYNRTPWKSFVMFIFIEEFTHHFWQIEDETDVKFKVLEIIKEYDKTITVDILKEWGIKINE